MSDNSKKQVIRGELLSYGFAPYQDDPTQRQSYFVEIKHDNGITKKEWGVDLERALNESNVQIGDTVILNNLGRQPVNIPDPQDETKTKTVTKNLWGVERYEPPLDLPNVIEHDTQRERQQAVTANKTKENEQGDLSTPNQAKKVPDLSEFDFELPDNIKNNYFGIVKNRYLLDQKINYYDKDDKNQVNIAFEDRNKSLHTSRQDEKTIYAMLDMAQAKNWTAIKLKGTDEFKQKAWLEASLRGIEVKGYEPNEKDLAELKARQVERTTNEVGMAAQKAPELKQEEIFNERLENPANNQAYLDKIGADFEGARAEHISNSFDKTREFANAFVSKGSEQKELVNFHNGYKAIISGNNLDKMLSNKAHQKSDGLHLHLTAVANADKLFENAVFGWEHKDKDEKSGNQIHRAIAPLKIDDQIYLAKLTIKELAREQGSRFYSLEAVEIEESKSPIPEMMREDLDKQELSQHRHNGALIDIIVKNAQEYNRENQKNVDDLQNYNKDQLLDEPQQTSPTQEEPLDIGVQTQEQSHVQTVAVTPEPLQPVVAEVFFAKDYAAEHKLKDKTQKTDEKTDKEIKQEIKTLIQEGIRDGSIKDRSDIVERLKVRGFEVLRENEKSITLSNPNGKDIRLEGKLFTKNYNAIKSLNESLKPENIKEKYPQMSDENIAKVNLWRENILSRFDTVEARQNALSRLKDALPNVANGKLDLGQPKIPANEIKPEIEVRIPDSGDQSRSR